MSDSNEKYKFYHYDPSMAAACVFAVIFGLSTLHHSILIAKHRTWYFIPLLIGGIFEIVGYAARGISSTEAATKTPVGTELSIGPFVVQTLLVLVAPALLAASIYMVLGRIIVSVDAERYSLIKKKWLTKTFVTSDVISFFVQLGGGGLMASSKASTARTGSHLVLAGLIVQIIIFGFFIAVAVVFHLRLRANPTTESHYPFLRWKKFLYILYITSGFIMVRSLVRVAEFVEGFEGYIIKHQVFLYVFDAVPMAAVMILFNIWYPSDFSKKARKVARSDVESASPYSVEMASK